MKPIYIAAILFTMFATACGSKDEKAKDSKAEATLKDTASNTVQLTPAQMQNAGVALGKLEQRNISTVLKVNGAIDVPPQNMVSVSVPLGGYLKSTKLLPGLHVSKGETIAVIEDAQYVQLQQDYLTASSKLVYAQKEFERQSELNKSKASSDKALQQAQDEYNTQQVTVKALAEKLWLIYINPDKVTAGTITRSISIPSPINGFVSKVNVNIGKYVNAADVLFEIVNPADIHLALNVFEKDVTKLHVGQKLAAYTNINPAKKYPCEIILIGKDFSDDHSVVVHCHFEQYDESLIPGMFMNAEIEVNSSQADALPDDAIVNYENKQFVFISRGNNKFEIVEVKTGASENGYTEITSDKQKLTAQAIVTKGAYSLLMKMKNTDEEE